jgi:endoglycosylceramidase
VRRCEKHGIYVFLDWHQDLYTAYRRCGDGAPKWAVLYGAKPVKTRVIWAEGYVFDRTLVKNFNAFWNNEEVKGRGLRDRFCDMLRRTVRYFNDCPNVMGYDVFNEPFPGVEGRKIFRTMLRGGIGTFLLSGNIDRRKLLRNAKKKDVMAMLSIADDPKVYHGVIDDAEKHVKKFDAGPYYAFFRAAAEAIRQERPDGVIFMENSYFSNTAIPCNTPRLAYDNGAPEKYLAFAPHGYDLTVDTPLTNEASPHRVDFIFNEHLRKQNELDVPVLVGEWGGMVPGGERYPALEHLIDLFDKNKWSQTYWHYLQDMKNTKIMDVLSRPYPQAVAGKIKRYGYDRRTGVFDLSYTGDGALHAPTVIYLPREPKKVFASKQYTLKPLGEAFLLQVRAGKGECAVKVEF